MQVVHSRRDSDAGIYWCEAENDWGIARSRNATLQVAGKFWFDSPFTSHILHAPLFLFPENFVPALARYDVSEFHTHPHNFFFIENSQTKTSELQSHSKTQKSVSERELY